MKLPPPVALASDAELLRSQVRWRSIVAGAVGIALVLLQLRGWLVGSPLVVSLVPGQYRVSLVGPPPASESRQVPLQVESDKPSHVVLERFAPMTVDEYFRGYTSRGGDASVEGVATPPGGLP